MVGQCDDIITTMLPNGPHVKSVVLGDGGIAEFGNRGTFIIDIIHCSRGVQGNCGKIKSEGIHMMDAPVSGANQKQQMVPGNYGRRIFRRILNGPVSILIYLGLQLYWLAMLGAETHVSLRIR